jgi:hypothetical protein
MLIAFPLQQWLHERASILRYTYIACVIIYNHQIRYAFQAAHLFWIFSSKPRVRACVCVCVIVSVIVSML